MAWEPLPNNYTDAVWSGLKRYNQIANEDGTVSFLDVTAYSNMESSFFGARDANRMNEALNILMSMGESGLPGGGETGQILAKRTAEDNDVEWIDAPAGAAAQYTTITIRASVWNSTTKTCTVNVSNISSTDYVILSPVLRSASIENRQQELIEYSRIGQGTPLDGSLYLAAFGDTPSMDLQVFCRIEKALNVLGHCVIAGKN